MSSEIVVAGIAFLGTAIGSISGVLAANKLTIYRISQLENKVDKHNTIIERTYVLEGQMKDVQENLKEIKNKIEG